MAQSSVVNEFKEKVWTLLTKQPFMPFRIVMESGDIISVEHPENFAMWPGPEANTFYLYGDGGRAVWGHFEKITSVEFRENTQV